MLFGAPGRGPLCKLCRNVHGSLTLPEIFRLEGTGPAGTGSTQNRDAAKWPLTSESASGIAHGYSPQRKLAGIETGAP